MSSRTKVLVIEDEPDMVMALRDNLEFEGYEVLSAESGELGLELARREKPACVLLDVMLPGADGFEICVRLRRDGCRAAIIMLTARGQEIDKVRGLELGADDYVTKPFGLHELLARIRAVIRRTGGEHGGAREVVVIGGATVCLATGRVRRGKKELNLGYYEAEILKLLLQQPGQVVERQRMLQEIWGLENEPLNRSVDNHVVSLRKKIERTPARPEHLLTVYGFGYKLVP